MERITTQHKIQTKFLICDNIPKAPDLYIYHTEYPRMFFKPVQSGDMVEMNISEVIDYKDSKGNLINDEVIISLGKEASEFFENYITEFTQTKIKLKRFSQEN